MFRVTDGKKQEGHEWTRIDTNQAKTADPDAGAFLPFFFGVGAVPPVIPNGGAQKITRGRVFHTRRPNNVASILLAALLPFC